jgi:alkane 1-monooxygenase
VGTPIDPASAPAGMNIYFYWLRSYFGNLKKSFTIAPAKMIFYWMITLAGCAALYYWGFLTDRDPMIVFFHSHNWGQLGSALGLQDSLWSPLGFRLVVSWLSISVVAILLLQTADYIEHYGLIRKELKPGVYEAVKPHHSWDSDYAFTNYFLYNLGLHSHHHMRSQLPFTELRMSNESRAMPFGYSLMVQIAFVPPLWRRVVGE